MRLKIGIVQTQITKDVNQNLRRIISFIKESVSVDILLFPEGMLSGYYPKDTQYLHVVGNQNLDEAINEIKKTIIDKKIQVIVPSALKVNENWYNSAMWFNEKGRIKYIYKKCNLSNLDRNHFKAGSKLEVTELRDVKTAVQLCREIKYPEQFLHLKLLGAKVIFHLNNNQDGIADWKNIFKTRAYENGIFIVSVNPTHDNQQLFSYVISPKGKVLLKTEADEKIYYVNLDTSLVVDKDIQQRRTDIVDIIYKGQ